MESTGLACGLKIFLSDRVVNVGFVMLLEDGSGAVIGPGTEGFSASINLPPIIRTNCVLIHTETPR